MPAFQPSRAARAAGVFAGAAGVAALVGGLLAAPHDVAPVLAGALLVLGVALAALWGYALYRPRPRATSTTARPVRRGTLPDGARRWRF